MPTTSLQSPCNAPSPAKTKARRTQPTKYANINVPLGRHTRLCLCRQRRPTCALHNLVAETCVNDTHNPASDHMHIWDSSLFEVNFEKRGSSRCLPFALLDLSDPRLHFAYLQKSQIAKAEHDSTMREPHYRVGRRPNGRGKETEEIQTLQVFQLLLQVD